MKPMKSSPLVPSAQTAARALYTILAVVLISAAEADYSEAQDDALIEVESGAVLSLEAPVPGEGQGFIYRWIASGGSPLSSSSRVFEWTAPLVESNETVSVDLTVRNAEGGCVNSRSRSLIVVPKSQGNLTSALTVTKTASKPSARVGESIIYDYEVKNTGESAVIDVSLRDEDLGDIPLERTTLQPGASETADANYTVTPEDLPGPIASPAIATGIDEAGRPLEASAIVSVNILTAEPGIRIDKGCIHGDTVRVGDSVTYVYNIMNTGGTPLTEVNVTDVPNWGPACIPVYIAGDDGNGVLEEGEAWRYECRYTVQDPENYQMLSIMQATGVSATLADKIRRLMTIQARLEIKMVVIEEKRDRFDLSRAESSSGLVPYEGKNLTLINYTNPVTEETLSQIIDLNGTIRQIDFTDPVTDGMLTTRYNWLGELKLEMYTSRRTNESLEVEYDLPVSGYRTYTVRDLVTGDTLITVVNEEGTVLSREYRKTPGFRILREEIWLKNVATVTAMGPAGVTVTDDDSFQLQIRLRLPALEISKRASPDPVRAGEDLTYIISYRNNGEGDAQGVRIEERYDRNITFVSSNPPPDQGSDNVWTIGTLARGASGEISITTNVNPTARNGAVITNRVRITGDENQTNQAVINTTVEVLLPVLIINKTASEAAITPGSLLTYGITYRNTGRGNATNVSITDILDRNVEFIASNPAPTTTWLDTSGQRHLWWSSDTLNAKTFIPGQSGSLDLVVRLSEESDLPREIFNLYKIRSDQADGSFYTLRTEVLRTLTIEKSADKASSYPGQMVNYTINISNPSDLDAEDVVVVDRLPGEMDLVGAVPEPSQANETVLVWYIGRMPARTNIKIDLTARIKERPEILFDQSGSVTGTGYVNTRAEFTTGSNEDRLTNYVEVTARLGENFVRDSDTFTVSLRGTAGTEIKTGEHGSGYYQQEEAVSYNSTNKSIMLDKDIFAKHSMTEFSLPGRREVAFNSLWHDRTTAENLARNETISESYLYSEMIDKESSFLLDENQSVYRSDGELLGGLAEISFVKRAPNRNGAAFKLSENYHGDFRIQESIDSYGSGVSYSKNATGFGFVSDKSSSRSHMSSESGSGFYRSNEISSSGVVYKDSDMLYQPNIQRAMSRDLVYTPKWHEEMATRDEKVGGEISERISSAEMINKETIIEGASMAILGEFNGTAEIRAVQKNMTTGEETARVEQVLEGSYKIDTSISIHKVPKYLRPHMSITKKALKQDENTVLFRINVTNDGNKTLGPVYITDVLPEGLRLINSSTRPRVSGRNLNWTLISLGIGRMQTIDVRARVRDIDTGTRFVNTVRSTGYFEGEPVAAAEASSSFVLDALPCCMIDIVSPENDSNVAYYRSSEDWAPGECLGLGMNATSCFEIKEIECSTCNSSETGWLDPPEAAKICNSTNCSI